MANSTTTQQIPYPELTDRPDGATQMKDLATKVDDLLSKGFTMPSGDITLGATTDTTGRFIKWKRLVGATVYEQQMWCSGSALAIRSYTDSVLQSTYTIYASGSIRVTGPDAVDRWIPFATSAGQVQIVISTAATSGSVVVTFPPGRFTQNPLAFANSTSNIGWVGSLQSVTNVQATVQLRNIDNTAGTGTFYVQWFAVQMTPTSTPGSPAMAREAGSTHTSTCYTEGCENEGIAITGEFPEGCLGVVCGACNQPITDSQTTPA